MSDSKTSHAAYCADEVRRLDRERYLATLFAPDDRRDAILALYAFNLEIAKTAEIVSETLLGEIRLQWWRDAIAEAFAGTVREHAVLAALADAIRTHDLDKNRLFAMIDARAADLDPAPPPDMEALEAYVAGTAGSLVELVLGVLGIGDRPTLDLGCKAGMAIGFCGLLRTVPFHARQRRLYIPASFMEQAKTSPNSVFDRQPPRSFASAVEPLAARARELLAAVRAARRAIPVEGRAAFLPLALADAYLARLRRNGHDVFAPGLEITPLGTQARLTWAAFRRRYSATWGTGPRQAARSRSARAQ